MAGKGYTSYQIANEMNMSSKTINNILKNYSIEKKIISFNNLKTRKSGPNKFIEFTIILPKKIN